MLQLQKNEQKNFKAGNNCGEIDAMVDLVLTVLSDKHDKYNCNIQNA